jgi:hypothetical protein
MDLKRRQEDKNKRSRDEKKRREKAREPRRREGERERETPDIVAAVAPLNGRNAGEEEQLHV